MCASMQHDGADDRDEHGDEAVDAECFDRIAGRVAEEVCEQADRRRPGDPAERVPHDKKTAFGPWRLKNGSPVLSTSKR